LPSNDGRAVALTRRMYVVGRHAHDHVTDQMNQVMASVGEKADTFSQRAARRVLRRVEW
jgi:hypothetical protein